MSEIEQKGDSKKVVNISVDWHVPENLLSQYASNVFVQAGEYEITLYFFQSQIPLLTGTPEENKASLEQIRSIKSQCVGKISVSPELVPKIITALQTTLDNYHAQKQLIERIQRDEHKSS